MAGPLLLLGLLACAFSPASLQPPAPLVVVSELCYYPFDMDLVERQLKEENISVSIMKAEGSETPDEYVRSAAEILRHPGFMPDILLNDIALIKLNETVDTSEYISYVKLPLGKISDSMINFCPTALGMGWGLTALSHNETSSILLCVELPVIQVRTCAATFPSQFARIFPTAMCTFTEENKDTCEGDTGGPLICKDSNMQLGIISIGHLCGKYDSPTVYTRVDSYDKFISKSMNGSANLDSVFKRYLVVFLIFFIYI